MIIFAQPTPALAELISSYGRVPNIFNLTSYNSEYPTLRALNPNPEAMGPEAFLSDFDGMTFDMAYMEYILNKSDNAFAEFFAMIAHVFTDPEICVVFLTADSPYRNSIKESLAKIIQQRYGYTCYMANTPQDIIDILERDEEPTFSITGLAMYEQDRTKWYNMIVPRMAGD